MAIFNSYVSSPEGNHGWPIINPQFFHPPIASKSHAAGHHLSSRLQAPQPPQGPRPRTRHQRRVVHHVEPQLAPLGALQQPAMGNAGKSTNKMGQSPGKSWKISPKLNGVVMGKSLNLNEMVDFPATFDSWRVGEKIYS